MQMSYKWPIKAFRGACEQLRSTKLAVVLFIGLITFQRHENALREWPSQLVWFRPPLVFQNRTRRNGAIAAEPPNNWKDLQCGTLAANLNTWVYRFLLWENCSRVQQLGEQLVDLFCGKTAAELIKQLGRFILWHTCRRDKQVGIYILICCSAYAGRVMWALFKIKLHETASLFSVLYWSIITHGVKYLRFRIMVKQGVNSVICCTVRTEKTKLDTQVLNVPNLEHENCLKIRSFRR